MSMAFDSAYYLSNNPDVDNAVADGEFKSAQQHWALFGADEGRNPNAVFNTADYLNANEDVAESDLNPLDHFMQFGAGEGRAPNASYADVAASFDGDDYLNANEDVADAVENGDFASAYQHWVLFGQFEDDRDTATFDNGTPVSDAIADNAEDDNGGGEADELTNDDIDDGLLVGTSGDDTFSVDASGLSSELTLTGKDGDDNFVFTAGNDGDNNVTITDFSAGDTLTLETFSSLVDGNDAVGGATTVEDAVEALEGGDAPLVDDGMAGFFEMDGDSYVYLNDGDAGDGVSVADDMLVKLSGVQDDLALNDDGGIQVA